MVTANFSKKKATSAMKSTAELHESGLMGTASFPNVQKKNRITGIRIVGFSLKIGYNGSLKFGCYYLQYVPASKPFDHA